MKPDLLNGSSLALIGDAYFELQVRLHLLQKGITNPKKLHNEAVRYVSATAHYKIVQQLMPIWTEEEQNIYRRGRNAKYTTRKNVDMKEYIESSGLEALIGYLYLCNNFNRLQEIVVQAIQVIEGEYHV